MVKEINLRLEKVIIKNKRDVDIYVTDCFGDQHIIFPGQEKKIIMLKKRRKR